MAGFEKVLITGMIASALATGCGDDGSGAGGGGGAGSSGSGDGGATTADGPTVGPGSTGSGSQPTSSPASNSSSLASSGSGGTCGSGEGTPDRLAAAYGEYCAIANDLAMDICGAEDQLEACLELEGLIVQAGAGCEAEQTALFACTNQLLVDGGADACNCDGGQLACPDIDMASCAPEEAAADACDACNG